MLSGSGLVKELYGGGYGKAQLGRLGEEKVRGDKKQSAIFSGCFQAYL